MSTPVCVSCKENLSCGDSPLSITGNVIGILTFVSAIIIALQVYVDSMRNAESKLKEMEDTLRLQYDKVNSLVTKLRVQSKNLDDDLKTRLMLALGRVQQPLVRASDLLGEVTDIQHQRKNRVWRRAKFIIREDMIKEGIEKIDKAMQPMNEVASEIFLQ
jgi:hypothetical protein